MNTVRYACHLVTIITDNVYRIFALVALIAAIAWTLMKNLTQKAIHVTWRRVDISTHILQPQEAIVVQQRYQI